MHKEAKKHRTMKYQVFMTKWNESRDAVNCGVNYPQWNTHNSGWKETNKQTIPSPQPAVLFHTRTPDCHSLFQECLENCVPILRGSAASMNHGPEPKVAAECPGGDWGSSSSAGSTGAGEHWAKGQNPTQMQNLSVFDLQLFGVFYLRANFPFPFFPVHTAVPEYSKSFLFFWAV